jgi:hypothetical protein
MVEVGVIWRGWGWEGREREEGVLLHVAFSEEKSVNLGA